jgi:hypothetical protein
VGELQFGFEIEDKLLKDNEVLVYPEDDWCEDKQACEAK